MLEADALDALDRAIELGATAVSGWVLDRCDAIRACDARRHPYGFVVVSLGESVGVPLIAYRLHIWPEGFRLPGSADLMIHDHVYSIVSCVLVGGLIQTEYAPSGGGDAYACYRGLYDGPHSVLERTEGRMEIEQAAVVEVLAGGTYSLPAGALHEVVVDPAVFTATVLRTEYGESPSDPIILAPFEAPATLRFDRDLLVEADTARTLDELFRRLT